MPIVIPTGHAQFTLNYQLTGAATGRAATVLGFGADADPISDADEFANLIGSTWDNEISGDMSQLVTLDSIYWATADQSGSVAVGSTGTRTGDLEMVNVAFLSSYYSGFKGPRARGRSYWPGLINSADTGDAATISSGRMANIVAALDGFFDALTTSGPTPVPQVILQRDEPGQVTPPLDPPPTVNRRAYSNRPATQRRRLRR